MGDDFDRQSGRSSTPSCWPAACARGAAHRRGQLCASSAARCRGAATITPLRLCWANSSREILAGRLGLSSEAIDRLISSGVVRMKPVSAAFPVLSKDGYTGKRYGRFEVLCKLGEGGMSEVFLAYQTGVGGFRRPVVLKRILDSIRRNEEFLRMFVERGEDHSALSATATSRSCYDLAHEDGELFMVMEFVAGATLVEVARACRVASEPIPIGFTLAAVRDTALALHYAHTFVDPPAGRGTVVHRDVAEKNIMVGFDGTTKLLDFGIAGRGQHARTTQVGTGEGHRRLHEPRAGARRAARRRASDVFSLGVVLHECLTGQRLFQRANRSEEVHALLERADSHAAASCNPEVIRPPSTRWCSRRCCATDAPLRFDREGARPTPSRRPAATSCGTSRAAPSLHPAALRAPPEGHLEPAGRPLVDRRRRPAARDQPRVTRDERAQVTDKRHAAGRAERRGDDGGPRPRCPSADRVEHATRRGIPTPYAARAAAHDRGPPARVTDEPPTIPPAGRPDADRNGCCRAAGRRRPRQGPYPGPTMTAAHGDARRRHREEVQKARRTDPSLEEVRPALDADQHPPAARPGSRSRGRWSR